MERQIERGGSAIVGIFDKQFTKLRKLAQCTTTISHSVGDAGCRWSIGIRTVDASFRRSTSLRNPHTAGRCLHQGTTKTDLRSRFRIEEDLQTAAAMSEIRSCFQCHLDQCGAHILQLVLATPFA